jgi:xylan 1,4-beta-xylosidase
MSTCLTYYSCADSYLMNTILRDHWNWTADNNYITSDCEAVSYISNSHHYASSNAAGTADAFNAGMDTSCEYSGSSDINGAWNQKLLNSTTVNRALTRLFQGLVRAGYFDGSKALYSSIGASSINTASAQQTALLAAQEAIVLTKNDGTLPLPLKSGSKVAMIGFWADTGADLQGGYSGTAPFLHTPAYAARQAGYSVTVAAGPNQSPGSDTWTTNAVAAAQKSDYIIFFGGLDPNAAGEGNDRSSLSWPTAQITLIQRLASLNKPLVVVQSGDQLDDTQLLNTAGVNGIFWASFPGQDGGTAIMNLISGAAAPAGRLPVTKYPANYTKVNIGDMALRPSGSNPGRTYRWYPTPVQPFGTGLHYTTFNATFGTQAGNMSYNIQSLVSSCSNTYPDTCPVPALPVLITNSGNRTSDFVALVFVQSQTGPTPYPLKTLVAYSRLKAIAPAQTSTAYLAWTLGDLARRDSNGNNILYPGTYTLLLDQPTQKTVNFTLTGTAATLETWPKAP